jgi:hypothetical protein
VVVDDEVVDDEVEVVEVVADDQTLKKRYQIAGMTTCLVQMAKPFRALTWSWQAGQGRHRAQGNTL